MPYKTTINRILLFTKLRSELGRFPKDSISVHEILIRWWKPLSTNQIWKVGR